MMAQTQKHILTMTTFSLTSSFIFKHNKTNLFEWLEKEKPSLTTWKRRLAYNFFHLCQSRLRQIRVKLKTILRCITVHLQTHSFEIKPWLSYEHSDILIWSCFYFTKESIHKRPLILLARQWASDVYLYRVLIEKIILYLLHSIT